jgi:hypothetical protein
VNDSDHDSCLIPMRVLAAKAITISGAKPIRDRRLQERKHPAVAVWTEVELEIMLSMWTQAIVSTWSDDGHLHAAREAGIPDVGREATDCRRGIGEGGVGSESGTSAWGSALTWFSTGAGAIWQSNWGSGAIKLLPARVSETSSG